MPIPGLRKSPPGSPPLTLSDFSGALRGYLDDAEVAEVLRAYTFGESAHAGQRRSSGEPFIHHPLAVAHILAALRLDAPTLTAAILHDVMEDTATARDRIVEKFGEDVAQLVDGVSKIDRIETDTREAAEAENLRKMLLAMSRDLRVILIKLADRLHNMRTLDSLPPKKRLRIARQTQEIYAPIANRPGLHSWSRELEDLSFRHTYANRHQTLARALRRRQGNRRTAMKKIGDALEKQLADSGIAARVSGREKNIYSIYRKMQSKRIHFRDVRDIYGFRVIVETVDHCYRALGAMHALYKPIPHCFKDYIAIPKVNGYQSLHTTVFSAFGETIEVQIRTEEMHRVAEAGIASHWLYKTPGARADGADGPHGLARQWLMDLLETQQTSVNPGEFLEHLRVDLFPDEVYVFTPRGDIKKLPAGATALDFAYAVHSDVGNRCIGARIGNVPAPLHTALKSGTQVEVVTARGARPSPAWLNFVVTGKARAAIRGALKNKRRKDSVKLGKKLLDNAVRTLRKSRPRIRSEQKSALLKTLRLAEWNDLLADIGLGNRMPMMVAHQLLGGGGEGEGGGAPQSIAVTGTEGVLVTYARCCRPLPGDEINGVLTAGKGMVVHTADCPNLGELSKRADKLVPIHWDDKVSGQFSAALRLDTENRPGVLASLAAVIADEESNINDVSVAERDGRYSTICFTLEVRHRHNLSRILNRLREQSGVVAVKRVKG